MIADRKSTRLNSSHTVIYTLSLHDALPISKSIEVIILYLESDTKISSKFIDMAAVAIAGTANDSRSEEHTSELQSHSDLHSFPTRRSSDLQKHRGNHPVPGKRYQDFFQIHRYGGSCHRWHRQ